MATEKHWFPIRVCFEFARSVCGLNRPARGKEADCEALALDARTWLTWEPVVFPSLGMRLYVAWLLPTIAGCTLLKLVFVDQEKNTALVSGGWGAIVISLLILPDLPSRDYAAPDQSQYRWLSNSAGPRQHFRPVEFPVARTRLE